MNKIITSAALSLAGLAVFAITPAKACEFWAWQPSSSHAAQGEYCRVSQRVNANGHTVIDIDQATVVVWDDNTAQVLSKDIPCQKRWFGSEIDREGDCQFLGAPGYSFSYRF